MPLRDGSKRSARLGALEDLLLAQPIRAWRTSEVARELGVSVDTAYVDLEEVSKRGRVLLTTEGKTAGHVWKVVSIRNELAPLRLGFAEGTALYAAARLLNQQQDARNDAARHALLSLIRVLPEQLHAHLEAIVSDLGPAQQEESALSQAFRTLAEGWLARRVVRLVYDPPHKRRYECLFAPYLLEPSGIGRTLYFIGHSDPPDALRTYRLERVWHAELTDDTFEVPPDFDGPALLRRAWGVMYGDDEPVHIKVRFSQFVSKRVRETRWHPSEHLTETNAGIIWEAEIGDITEIRPWLRGWGADCEVLEPTELRQEMITEARRLSRLYGLAQTSPGIERSDGPDQSLLDTLYGKD